MPTVAEKHAIANAHSAMTWERMKDATQSGRKSFSDGVETTVGKIQELTGLQLRETFGWGEQVKKEAAQKAAGAWGQVKAVTEEKAHEVKTVAEEKVHQVKAVVEEKAHDVKVQADKAVEGAEKKVEEVKKRLV